MTKTRAVNTAKKVSDLEEKEGERASAVAANPQVRAILKSNGENHRNQH